MTAQSRLAYPSKAKVKGYVDLARELALDVAGFEVGPDGTIRILSAAAFPAAPKDEFEASVQAGEWD